MDNKYILALDLGTQSARASLIDQNGNLVFKEKREYKPVYLPLENGKCEQNPDTYFDYLSSASQALTSKHKDLMPQVIGVVLTTFRDTAVLLDKNYKVLRPSILWLDQRVSHYTPKLPFYKRFLFKLVNMSATLKSQQQKTIAHWVKENEPKIWKQVDKYVNISTYLNYLMTGNLIDTVANIVGHYPINYKKRKWYSKHELKQGIFDIPSSTYPKLINPGEIIGYISKECEEKTGITAGLPLIATGSDKSCESLGNGCIEPTFASISYGTASTITITSKKYVEPSPFMPAYASVQNGYYNSELQIYRGYWMLNWFKDEFCKDESLEASIQNMATLDILNQKMIDIGPGSEGLILQPYWGPSLERPNSRGAIVGFSEKHTKIHLYRSIIEGIALCLREGKEHIEKKQRKKVEAIVVSGGGSISSAICQITADIFNLPVYKVHTFETSSLGAAMAGFIACGVYHNYQEAKDKMVHYESIYKPNLENAKKYDYLFENAYKKLYPHLKKIYTSLREFTNEKL